MDLMVFGMAALRQSITDREELDFLRSKQLVQRRHGLLFFFIGMALDLNLDTSLLTAKVFKVENFANLTLFMYFGTVLSVTLSYLFFIKPQFFQLVVSLWLLLVSRLCHLFIALYARGKTGRAWFLVFYTFNGFLRGVISLSSTYIISTIFSNRSYLHIANGGSFFSLLLSFVQLIYDMKVGTHSVHLCRIILVIIQFIYVVETMATTIWATSLYMIYGRQASFFKNENFSDYKSIYDENKSQDAMKKFGYTKYYTSKLVIFIVCNLFRVIFHPVLIPYFMDINHSYKLLASITFIIFELFSRLYVLNRDEYIDPSGKTPGRSDEFYLFLQDWSLYFLLAIQFFICFLCLYSTWNQKLGISKNPVLITLVTLVSGSIYGYLENRTMSGSHASLVYYYHTNPGQATQGQNNSNGLTKKVIDDTANVNDILTLLNYSLYLTGSLFSYLFQHILTDHKQTLRFILSTKQDYMDLDTLNLIMGRLNY